VSLVESYFIIIWYYLYEYVKISTCLLCSLISPAHFVYVDLLTLCSLCSVSFGNGNGE